MEINELSKSKPQGGFLNYNQLTEVETKKIIDDANTKMIDYSKQNSIIGDQVFKILAQNCRVLCYPLEDDDVWGFLERIDGQQFVCINTSILYEKQIFTAAHELYHIWFDDEDAQEIILSSNLEEANDSYIDINELKANRFAAEFLAETKLLEQEMSRFGIAKNAISLKDVVFLCDIFTIPYKTMVKRLHEINAINHASMTDLFLSTEKEISEWKTILGIITVQKQDYIALDNLVEKSKALYDKNLITYERLDYLLSFAKVKPENIGITKSTYTPLTEDEIAEILEEDDV